jgi:hypothetical protein
MAMTEEGSKNQIGEGAAKEPQGPSDPIVAFQPLLSKDNHACLVSCSTAFFRFAATGHNGDGNSSPAVRSLLLLDPNFFRLSLATVEEFLKRARTSEFFLFPQKEEHVQVTATDRQRKAGQIGARSIALISVLMDAKRKLVGQNTRQPVNYLEIDSG